MNKKPRVLLITGPSGVGKSTVIRSIVGLDPKLFYFSISHTTRSPRPNERDGREYHFVSKEHFKEKLKTKGFFLESTLFAGNYYGTSLKSLSKEHDKVNILDLDETGVRNIHDLLENNPDMMNVLFIRVTIDEETLRKRLMHRKEKDIERRLEESCDSNLTTSKDYDLEIENVDSYMTATSIYSLIKCRFL